MKKQNLLFLGIFLTLCFSMLTGIAVKGEINTLKSYKATITPTIDGTFTEAEWADAYHTSFYHEPDANHPNDYVHIYMKNTQDKLYILFDDLPDNTSDNDDYVDVFFDCNYDNIRDDNVSMNLRRDHAPDSVIGNSMVHWAMGFGASPNQARDHTIMEVAINISFSSSYDGNSRPDEMNYKLPVGNANNSLKIFFIVSVFFCGWSIPQTGDGGDPTTYAELTLNAEPQMGIPFATSYLVLSILIIATVSIGWTVSRKKLTIN